MDIALAIEKLLPAANYRRADDYATLAATWHDSRPIPTEAALIAAWEACEADTAKAVQASGIRSGLAVLWASAPDHIVGAFQDRMNIAEQLLDAGKPGAVNEMLKNVEPPADWDSAKVTEFNDLFSQMQTGITAIMN